MLPGLILEHLQPISDSKYLPFTDGKKSSLSEQFTCLESSKIYY